MDQPTPFTIVREEGKPPVASNGKLALVVYDGGELRLRRGIRTSAAAPIAERIVPYLNQLAGDLLANSTMPPHEIASRLHVLQMACVPPERQNIEWAYAELNGVRVYTDGDTVVVSTKDLQVG